MSSTISPNMSLVIPTVGQEPGPTYADDLNVSLTLIDRHDHTPGNGIPITPTGLNINAALSFQSNDATNINSAVFTAQTTASSTLQSISVAPGSESPPVQDLWYTDSNGVQIQLTNNGQLAAVPTSVVGVSYAAGTFFFKQTPDSLTNPAALDAGSVIIRPNAALTTYGVVLNPPGSISSEYPIQLPLLPASQSFMTLDNSGNMATPIPYTGGIARGNLATGAIAAETIQTKTGNYTVLSTDDVVLADATSGALTITLYTAVGNSGRVVTIKKTDTTFTAITIACNGAQTVDGTVTTTLNTKYESIQVMSNGTNWVILSRTIPSISTAYTPTFSAAFGTVSAIAYFYKRQGNLLYIYGTHTNGTTAASLGSITLPTGLLLDSATIGIPNTTTQPGLVVGSINSYLSTAASAAIVTAVATDTTVVYVGGIFSNNVINRPNPAANSSIGVNNQSSSVQFTVPISGWKG